MEGIQTTLTVEISDLLEQSLRRSDHVQPGRRSGIINSIPAFRIALLLQRVLLSTQSYSHLTKSISLSMKELNSTNQYTATRHHPDHKHQPIIKLIARELRKHHISYNESKYIFKQARQIAELKPPKNRKKGTVTRLSKDELERWKAINSHR